MLNDWDIEFMGQTVREIVTSWNSTLTIFSPLPYDQQPNYNVFMREFNGEILYKKLIVPAERKDIVNNQTNNIPPDEIAYGDKNAGIVLYSIPDIIPIYDTSNNITGRRPFKPNNHDIFAIDDSEDRYYIKSMRDRMGETLVTLYRLDGGTPNGIGNIDDIIVVEEVDPDVEG